MSDTLVVTLKRGRSKPFWVGHPWVFSGAIHKVEGAVGDTGGPCVVLDERGNTLGAGFYNPHGAIRVRILQHRRTTDRDFEVTPLLTLVEARLKAALERRRALGLPAEGTTGYRLANAEGDSLTGLVVDVLGQAAVVQLNSRAMYEARDALRALVQDIASPKWVALVISEDSSRLEGIPVMAEVYDAAGQQLTEPLKIAFEESGVRYEVTLGAGQKTGFYFDQRDNRWRFAELCEGRRVLDLYCYHGAFGLNALAAGATHASFVDSSGPAIEAVQANLQLNGIEPERASVYKADAITLLKEARAEGRTWDRITCDPPKFARGRSHVDDAVKKYARLNTLAMSVLSPGGLLLTCSCSQHISRDAFVRMLTDAGHRLRRSVNVHALWGQGVDHPFGAVAQEGDYLKAALVSLG